MHILLSQTRNTSFNFYSYQTEFKYIDMLHTVQQTVYSMPSLRELAKHLNPSKF